MYSALGEELDKIQLVAVVTVFVNSSENSKLYLIQYCYAFKKGDAWFLLGGL